LINLLDDTDVQVRRSAVAALFLLKATDAVAEIGKLALSDPDTWVRKYAILALRTIGTQEARDALEEVITRGDSIKQREIAYRALSQLDAAQPSLDRPAHRLHKPEGWFKRLKLWWLYRMLDNLTR